MSIQILGLAGLPEITPGADLPALIRDAAGPALTADSILVVVQKVISKAEGAVVDLRTIEASPFASNWASQWNLDPRVVELVIRQSCRIVKMDRGVLIAETHQGFIAANAGVDRSNVPGDDFATVLPADPDVSARRLHASLGCGAVIISDTFGRPWREGLVNVALGVSGLDPLEDYRGLPDRSGRRLQSTVVAVADELAAAAGLVMRKTTGVPAALILGFEWKRAEGSARKLFRPPGRDLFR